MASCYIEELRLVQPNGPYYIGGYCYGGIIAYEIACQLSAQGEEVGLLMILEGYAPIGAIGSISRDNFQYLVDVARNFPGWFLENRERGFRRMLAEVSRRVVLFLKFTLNRIGFNIRFDVENFVDATTQIPENQRKLFEAQIVARNLYKPDKYPGSLTLFRVKRLSLTRPSDPTMGWGELATGGVDVKFIPGYHYNILQQPHVENLAHELKLALDDAEQ
jgi:thioesterase domain-containing protein